MVENLPRFAIALALVLSLAGFSVAQSTNDSLIETASMESAGIKVLRQSGIGSDAAATTTDDATGLFGVGSPEEWTKPQKLSSTLQVMLLMTVISLAPAVLLMTTSFVRVIVVLGLLRQALGTQQAPPGQVLTSIALFVTLLVMTPVWNKSYNEGVKPYTEGHLTMEEAFDLGTTPIRKFMGDQIHRTDNHDSTFMFLERLPEAIDPETDEVYTNFAYYSPEADERLVPLAALLPAYMLSELKTAFLIGFQVYLPFVILDIVVASVTISMGMLMLPPVLVSLPFKLLLFVLVDGWRLVIGMLLESFSY